MQNQNESIFGERGLATIFEGEVAAQLNRDGTVNHYWLLGFRYEDPEVMRASGCSIIEGSRRVPNNRGVYRAGVVVRGVSRDVSKSGFFPQALTRAEIVQAISEAYERRELIQNSQRLYKGKSGRLTIFMWLDAQDRIIDAMPRMGKHFSKAKQALIRYQQTGQRGKLLCHVCYKPRVLVCPDGHGQPPSFIIKKLRGVRRWYRWFWYKQVLGRN
jgi:hypothetical protein